MTGRVDSQKIPIQQSQAHSENDSAKRPVQSNSSRGVLAEITHVANSKNLDPREVSVEGVKHQTLDAKGLGHVERGELHEVQLIHADGKSQPEQLKSKLATFLKNYETGVESTSGVKQAQLIEITNLLKRLSPTDIEKLKSDPEFQTLLETLREIPYDTTDLALGMAITFIDSSMVRESTKDFANGKLDHFLREWIDGIHDYPSEVQMEKVRDVCSVLNELVKGSTFTDDPAVYTVFGKAIDNLKEDFHLTDIRLEEPIKRPETPESPQETVLSSVSVIGTLSTSLFSPKMESSKTQAETLHSSITADTHVSMEAEHLEKSSSSSALNALKRAQTLAGPLRRTQSEGVDGDRSKSLRRTHVKAQSLDPNWRAPEPESPVEDKYKGMSKARIIAEKMIEEINAAGGKQYEYVGLGKAKLVIREIQKDDLGNLDTSINQMVKIIPFSKEKIDEIKEEAEKITRIIDGLFQANLAELSGKFPSFGEILKGAKTIEELEDIVGKLSLNTEDRERMNHEIASLKASGKNLALDFTLEKGDDVVKTNEVTYLTHNAILADGDLEKLLKDKSLSLEVRRDLVQQLFQGLNELQKAGFVHGDLKPDNVLFYKDSEGKITLKLTDFGKSHALERKAHTGNYRFVAPERGDSFKAEVYSVALLAIRILEAPFLEEHGSMLVEPERRKSDEFQNNRTGIEKFVVLNEQFPNTENTNLWGRVTIITSILAASSGMSTPVKSARSEIIKYIDKLTELQKGSSPQDQAKIDGIHQLLLAMTETQPEQRPSLEAAISQISALANPV